MQPGQGQFSRIAPGARTEPAPSALVLRAAVPEGPDAEPAIATTSTSAGTMPRERADRNVARRPTRPAEERVTTGFRDDEALA